MANQTRSHWKNGVLNFVDTGLDSDFKTGVWQDCPILAIQSNPSIGYICEEHFTNNETALATPTGYTATQATSGTFVIADGIGGIAQLDSGAGVQHQGITVQKLGANFTPAANKDLWFECRFKAIDTVILLQTFIGLSTTDGNLLASGDLASADSEYIGFGIETTKAGVMSFYECKATAELSDSLGATGTLAEDTYIKVGFKVTGITGIQCWINGVEQTLTNVVASGIPVTDAMTPTFICQCDGATDPIVTLDWYRAVQLI